MYEYKILNAGVKEAEKLLNEYGKEGWRLVSATPNIDVAVGLVVMVCTLERRIPE